MLFKDFLTLNKAYTHHAILLLSRQFEQHFLPQNEFIQFAQSFCDLNISVNNFQHPDLLMMNNGKKHLNLEDVQKIKSFCTYPPQLAKRRLICIERAERLNQNSANFLLKSLEEPSANVLFLLTTSQKHMLLPTILSRMQKINIHFSSLPSPKLIEIFASEHSDVIRNAIYSFSSNIFFGKSLLDKKNFCTEPRHLLYLIDQCEILAKTYTQEQLRSLVLYWTAERLKKDKPFVMVARFIIAHIREWKRIEILNPSAQFWLLRIILGHHSNENI